MNNKSQEKYYMMKKMISSKIYSKFLPPYPSSLSSNDGNVTIDPFSCSTMMVSITLALRIGLAPLRT